MKPTNTQEVYTDLEEEYNAMKPKSKTYEKDVVIPKRWENINPTGDPKEEANYLLPIEVSEYIRNLEAQIDRFKNEK